MAKETQMYRTVFGLCGRGKEWDDLGERHWNMYNIIYETSHQSRFNAWYRMLGAGALGWPRGMVWGGRREGFQDGEHVYTRGEFMLMYGKTNTLTWIHHRCTWVPNPELPSHLPSHIISLGHPHAPAPSMLYPASDTDWRFNSYMIVYMLECHSPSPSESKSPLYTSVSFLLSCIQGHHCHLSKFHIYVLVYCIGVFLSGLLHSV